VSITAGRSGPRRLGRQAVHDGELREHRAQHGRRAERILGFPLSGEDIRQ